MEPEEAERRLRAVVSMPAGWRLEPLPPPRRGGISYWLGDADVVDVEAIDRAFAIATFLEGETPSPPSLDDLLIRARIRHDIRELSPGGIDVAGFTNGVADCASGVLPPLASAQNGGWLLLVVDAVCPILASVSHRRPVELIVELFDGGQRRDERAPGA